jgi:3-oxoacyl-[acyl-carrier protein] reductase
MLLQNKSVIITGGTRGIGKAIVLLFLKQGAEVAFFGTNLESGKKAEEEYKTLYPEAKVVFYQVNVAKQEEVDHAIKGVLESFGKVDILINNAGITKDGLLMKMSEEDWDAVLNTNLKGVFNTCKAMTRPMLKAKSGKIINITSVVGLIGNGGQTNYAASKAGIIGFTKSLAKELASRNILVNCIAPGFIQTAMTDVLPQAQKDQLLSQIPMQRLGQPEEIANVALFLASALSNYITGQVLTVDGGMVMS